MSFVAEILANLGWRWIDGAIDDSKLLYTEGFSEGIEANMAEAVWHIEDRVLAAGMADLWDLTHLTRQLFGDIHETTFARIKGILIVNQNTNDVSLMVGGAPYDQWWEPFGREDDTVEVPSDSPLLLANRGVGWAVEGYDEGSSSSSGESGANRMLQIEAGAGGAVTYSLAIIGTITASSSSSSSSSGE